MKKLLTVITIIFCSLSSNLFAQAPDGVNYQAVVRDVLGLPLNNQSVAVRFTIHQGSSTGPSVFQEVHATTTNQFGLINLELGSVDNVNFSAINWGTGGAYYLQIEVDGGSGFDDLGASQLLSVPYALFARSAATGAQGFNSLIDTVSATLAQCPTGGYVVQAGLDANANTILDVGEITSSFPVCNGTTGAAVNSDTSATNEIQTISINATNDTIFLSNGGFVELPSLGNDNWGTDVVNTTGANITGDGTIGNPLAVIDNDTSSTNELELPLTGNTLGDIMVWNGSAWVSQAPSSGTDADGDGWPSTMDLNDGNNLITFYDNDNDSTNEFQTLSFTDPNLTLSNGGGIIDLSSLSGGLWQSSSPNIYFNSGYVGIGLINPTVELDVAGAILANDVTVQNNFIFQDAGNTAPDYVLMDDGAGVGNAIWQHPDSLGISSSNLWQSNAPNIYFNTGNVGIGTATASSPLTVNTLAGAEIEFVGGFNSDITAPSQLNISSGGVTVLDANSIFLRTSLTDRLVISNGGNVGIGTTTPSSKLNIVTGVGASLLELEGSGLVGGGLHFIYQSTTEGYEIRSDDQGGINMEASGNNKISFETSSNERMRITGSGNVGIGTTTPSVMLDVAGSTTVGGNLLINGVTSAVGVFNADGDMNFGNAATDLIDFIGTVKDANAIIFDGATIGGFTTTLAITDPTANQTITLQDGTGTLAFLSDIGSGGIYNGSGTLSGSTTVTQGANSLTFSSTSTAGFNIDNNVSGNRVLTIQNIADGTPAYTAGSIGARVGVSVGGAQTATGIESKVTGTTSNNKIGGWFSAEGTGAGWNRGLNASAKNSTGTNLGVDVTSNSNTGTNYGMRVNMGGTGTGVKYGVRVTTAAGTAGTTYGLYLNNNATGTKYGIYSFGDDRNYFSGDVGIGTATPGAKLDVIGKVKITDGTEGSGKILTSDASGVATWKTNQIAFESYPNGNGSVQIGGFSGSTPINFDATIFNDGNMYDATPGANYFRPTVDGVYSLEASIILDYSAGGPNDFVEMIFVKNGIIPGVKKAITRINSGDRVSLIISATMHLNAGDTIHIEAANQAGGTQLIPAGEDSWFSGHIVYED